MLFSLDLLYMVSTIAIMWVAVFICWVCYSVIQTSREVTKTFKDVNHKIEHIEEIATTLKDRVQQSAAIFNAVGVGVRQIEKFVQGRRGRDEVVKDKKTKSK